MLQTEFAFVDAVILSHDCLLFWYSVVLNSLGRTTLDALKKARAAMMHAICFLLRVLSFVATDESTAATSGASSVLARKFLIGSEFTDQLAFQL